MFSQISLKYVQKLSQGNKQAKGKTCNDDISHFYEEDNFDFIPSIYLQALERKCKMSYDDSI